MPKPRPAQTESSLRVVSWRSPAGERFANARIVVAFASNLPTLRRSLAALKPFRAAIGSEGAATQPIGKKVLDSRSGLLTLKDIDSVSSPVSAVNAACEVSVSQPVTIRLPS